MTRSPPQQSIEYFRSIILHTRYVKTFEDRSLTEVLGAVALCLISQSLTTTIEMLAHRTEMTLMDKALIKLHEAIDKNEFMAYLMGEKDTNSRTNWSNGRQILHEYLSMASMHS